MNRSFCNNRYIYSVEDMAFFVKRVSSEFGTYKFEEVKGHNLDYSDLVHYSYLYLNVYDILIRSV